MTKQDRLAIAHESDRFGKTALLETFWMKQRLLFELLNVSVRAVGPYGSSDLELVHYSGLFIRVQNCAEITSGPGKVELDSDSGESYHDDPWPYYAE